MAGGEPAPLSLSSGEADKASYTFTSITSLLRQRHYFTHHLALMKANMKY